VRALDYVHASGLLISGSTDGTARLWSLPDDSRESWFLEAGCRDPGGSGGGGSAIRNPDEEEEEEEDSCLEDEDGKFHFIIFSCSIFYSLTYYILWIYFT
jgi:hypothetical protein